ncbi:thioredoxin family protein [Halobacteriaceae archaeon GCM10025711]
MVEVVLFTQPTCSACATQKERNEGIEEAFPEVTFREVDIRSDLETAEEYGVRKTPTTLVYADGERIHEYVGVVERDDLETAIQDANAREEPGVLDRIGALVGR